MCIQQMPSVLYEGRSKIAQGTLHTYNEIFSYQKLRQDCDALFETQFVAGKAALVP